MCNDIYKYVSSIESLEEDALLRILGDVAQRSANSVDVAATLPERVPVGTMGIRDDLLSLGKKINDRWCRELYNIICGNRKEDEEDRNNILSQLGVSRDTAVLAATSILVNFFGLIPAVAAVVATVFFKRFAKPVKEEVCAFWKERVASEHPDHKSSTV
jgi:hypothetical protein